MLLSIYVYNYSIFVASLIEDGIPLKLKRKLPGVMNGRDQSASMGKCRYNHSSGFERALGHPFDDQCSSSPLSSLKNHEMVFLALTRLRPFTDRVVRQEFTYQKHVHLKDR